MLFEQVQLEPDEKVLKIVRKHWFVIITELLLAFFMLLLPFFILFAVVLFPDTLAKIDLDLSSFAGLIVFAIAGWTIMTLMVGFATWTHYYLDLWIITNKRIILVDQVHFFNRNISMFRLERLQDINVSTTGIIATLLNFGTMKVQTAGAHASHFKTAGLPDPRNLQAMIQKAADERIATMYRNPHHLE
jgi:hypothetical protein